MRLANSDNEESTSVIQTRLASGFLGQNCEINENRLRYDTIG